MRPEKPWFCADGRGFDSPHLHHARLTQPLVTKTESEEPGTMSVSSSGASGDSPEAPDAFVSSIGVDEAGDGLGESLR